MIIRTLVQGGGDIGLSWCWFRAARAQLVDIRAEHLHRKLRLALWTTRDMYGSLRVRARGMSDLEPSARDEADASPPHGDVMPESRHALNVPECAAGPRISDRNLPSTAVSKVNHSMYTLSFASM